MCITTCHAWQVPFFVFTIGPLAKIFAHTDPTAWTRQGRCVAPDPNGLSSYLDWLKDDILNPNGKLPAPPHSHGTGPSEPRDPTP